MTVVVAILFVIVNMAPQPVQIGPFSTMEECRLASAGVVDMARASNLLVVASVCAERRLPIPEGVRFDV